MTGKFPSFLPFLNGNVSAVVLSVSPLCLGVGDWLTYLTQRSPDQEGPGPPPNLMQITRCWIFEADAVTGLWQSWEGVSIFHMLEG